MYPASPRLRVVEGAVFHALRITCAALVVADLDRLRRFYEDIGGLEPAYEDPDGGFVCLRGTSSNYDLVLFAARDGLEPGLHHVSFELDDGTDLDAAAAALPDLGYEIERRIDADAKRSVFLRDPDGIGVELYQPGPAGVSAPSVFGGRSGSPRYLV